MQKLLFILFIFCICIGAAYAAPNDISVVTITTANDWIYGEAFINSNEIIHLAQTYNIDPTLLTAQHLEDYVWGYFDFHFAVESSSGTIKKILQGMTNDSPEDFLSSGLLMKFSISLEAHSYPLTFSSNLFMEKSKISTCKLLIKDNQGKLYEDKNSVLLTMKQPSFTFDIKKPDFSAYYFSPLDSDRDGLVDDFEKLYEFDLTSTDTDGDTFSDFEELFMGWDPFNAELAEEQTRAELEQEIQTFAEKYRRKPTWKYLILSINEFLASSFLEEDSQIVLETLKLHELEKERSSEEILYKKFLASLEHDLYKRFDWNEFIVLLGFALLLGFLHTGLSGPGKGIVIAYLAKEDREFQTGLSYTISFTIVHLGVTAVLSVIFLMFTSLTTIDIQSVLYIVQLSAGGILTACAIFFIIRSWKKLREHIVVSKKTFLDRRLGGILIGGVTALGTSPYLWSLFDFLMKIEQPFLIPLIFLAFGIGIAVCMLFVVLAVIGIRHIVFDIFPKFIHYAEMASALLFLFFALFFLFPYIPF